MCTKRKVLEGVPLESDSDEDYLNYILSFKVLYNKEYNDYAIKALEGDINAKNILINHSLKIVFYTTKSVWLNLQIPENFSFMDLMQEGTEALLVCIPKYDPKKGDFKHFLQLFVYKWFCNVLLRKGLTVRLYSGIYSIILEYNSWERNNSHLPEEEKAKVRKSMRYKESIYKGYLLNSNLCSLSEEPILEEVISMSYLDFNDVYYNCLKTEINTLLNKLPIREQSMVRRYFGFDTGVKSTFSVCGKEWKVCEQMARNIILKAIDTLRRSKELKFYLEEDVSWEKVQQKY